MAAARRLYIRLTYWMVEIAVNNRRDGSLYTVTTAKHYDASEAEEPHDKKIFSSESGTAKAQVSLPTATLRPEHSTVLLPRR